MRAATLMSTAALFFGSAESEGADPTRARKHGRHHEEMPNLVGAKVGYTAIFESDEQGALNHVPAVVGGVLYERVVIHRWLEIEASTPVGMSFGDPNQVFMPIDLHFKKPFHPSPAVSLYVGLGPAFDLSLRPETELALGGSSQIGAYFWPRERFGIDLEIDYNILRDSGEWVHEITIATGPVVRF